MAVEPLVTILVPVHNAGPYLRLAVDSILAQTFSDFEVIVIDDGSTDGCVESLPDPHDSRVQVLSQSNRGAPAALNSGLERARGSLIAFLDHDDLWLPQKLAAHVECFATSAGLDLAFDWSRMIDENGGDLGVASRAWAGPITFQQLVEDFVIGNTSALVVRKSALRLAGPFNEHFHRVYDTDMCWRVAALRPGNCRAVEQCLTRYRRHPGQMSRGWRDLQREWDELLSLVPGYAPCPVVKILPVADSNMRRYFSALACEQGDAASALKLAVSAFSRAPGVALTDPRNWMVLGAGVASAILPRSIFEPLAAWGKKKFRA